MIKRTSMAKTKKMSSTDTAPESTTAPPTPSPSVKGRGYMRALPMVVALVLVIGGGAYFVKAAMNGKDIGGVPASQVRDGVDPKEISDTIERVRELVVISGDEMPTVATIQDINILRPQNPTLYRDAENGDKLLVWSDKVVVYSMSKNRLLVAMPINVEVPKTNDQPQSAPAPEAAKIEVRNGTPTAGKARVVSDQLKALGFTMLAPTDAKSKEYAKTQIWVSSDKAFPETIKRLVEVTGGEVVNALPKEGATEADILIVVGK